MHIKIFGSFFFFCFLQKQSRSDPCSRKLNCSGVRMIQRNFKLCDFPIHSVCLLLFSFNQNRNFCPFFTTASNFTVNFQRYFWSKYKFYKIFEGTRSLNLHLHEPGVLAQAISGPGHTCQETISSHLNIQNYDSDLEIYCLNCKI